MVAERNYDRFIRADEMYIEIENCKKPIIAALNGVTIGAGLELALLCDIRIASEIAFFSLPEAKPELSIIPGLGGTDKTNQNYRSCQGQGDAVFGKDDSCEYRPAMGAGQLRWHPLRKCLTNQ